MDAVVKTDEAGNLALKPMAIDDYLKIRSDAGEEFVRQAEKGNRKEARLLAVVRDSLDEALGTAPMTSNVKANDIKLIQRALDTTRKYKQTYEGGAPGGILKRGDGDGGFAMEESKIPARIIRSPESAKQFVRAFGKDPDSMAQARGVLIDKITTGNPDTWVKNFNAMRPQAKAILQDHFPLVSMVMRNLDSELSVGRLAQAATGRGSITSQGITAREFLQNRTEEIKKLANAGTAMVFGQIAGYGAGGGVGTLVGGITGAAVGQSMARAADRAAKEIRSLVVRGLRDPEFAKQLLAAKPTAWGASTARGLSYAVGQQSGIQAGQSFREERR